MAENLEARDGLLALVHARLERFMTSRDPAVMLDPAALAEVTALPGADLEAALAAGLVRWIRYLVIDQGEGQEDLLALLRPVYDTWPDLVPGQVREHFDAATAPGPEGQETAAGRSVRLLLDALSSGSVSKLAKAADLFRELLATTPEDHPDRAELLSNLGTALQARSELSGTLADLDEAITIGRQAVAAAPGDHPDRAVMLTNLSNALQARFERSGSVADLDEAITAIRQAVAATPGDHPDRAVMLSTLGNALQARSERSGSVADLDEAITTLRQAVTATPGDHPNRARRLSSLGATLRVRSERSGSTADLDEAITMIRQAVTAAPGDHPNRAVMLTSLGNALQARFGRSGATADLDEAITVGRQVVAATPGDHPARAVMLSNLGNALQARFGRSGATADLDEAITIGRQAVAATPGDHPARARYQSNLGIALQARFGRSGSTADLDEAITTLRQAVAATPGDHPNRAATLSNLGNALQARFGRSGSTTDLDEAITTFRQAAATQAAPPGVRVRAANKSAQVATSAGRWPEAAAGYGTAVSLLGLIAPRSLARSDQEHALGNLTGLATDAAACCIRAGQKDRAVELLEQGRAILLGQALDTRTDLTSLAEQHPGLADEFTTLREALDQATHPSAPMPLPPSQDTDPASTIWDKAERQRATAEAFDRLITQIRDQPGFDGFLRPMPVRDLAPAASGGPVVIINVSSSGSCALILTASGVLDPIPLPGITPSIVTRQVSEFLAAFEDHSGRTGLDMRLTAILGWLWDAITAPVLDHLGLTTRPPDSQPWPRLWWCLPGLLSFLPLHAAGHHDTRASAQPETVIDRVVSSYTPTIRALLHAQHARPAPASAAVPALVIAMPHTPGMADLPGAQDEASNLRQLLGPGVRTLTGPQTIRDAVLENLPAARWAHFACHGTASPDNPSASCLHLTDQQLTVTDIARLRLQNADLAYLSACSTAQPGPHLADEAIHLASAFQLAGYRHVIGTLWPVSDHAAARTARQVYDTLTRTPSPPGTARAVHQVTRSRRDRYPASPAAWASHIHIGP